MLELGILNGEIESTSSALDMLTEFLFKPATRELSLEMQVSSSMVKELTPFVLYLRNLAKPGQLLVIDEPEMNLHPAAQVRFNDWSEADRVRWEKFLKINHTLLGKALKMIERPKQ